VIQNIPKGQIITDLSLKQTTYCAPIFYSSDDAQNKSLKLKRVRIK